MLPYLDGPLHLQICAVEAQESFFRRSTRKCRAETTLWHGLGLILPLQLWSSAGFYPTGC